MSEARSPLRPYVAVFAGRFRVMLQYRAAALAGFATQCWWGAIHIMIFAAFYHGAPRAAAPISLAQAVTYTWLAQAFLALMPWAVDPDVALAVRSGAVGFDRLRPASVYGLWYASAAGWMTSRALPRAALMFLAAGVVLPLAGLGMWSWRPPGDLAQGALFLLSLTLTVALAASIVMLLNVVVAATLTDRGVNNLVAPLAIVLSGNLIPLPLFPSWARLALFVQPFAGVVDIPFRIYCGNLAGAAAWAGVALQGFWTAAIGLLGSLWLRRVMARLQVQGG
jgi:viologen exporter family transport system permease protein